MGSFKDIKGRLISKGDLILITPSPNYENEYIKGVFISYENDRLRYYPLNEFGVNTIREENSVPDVEYFSKREFVLISPTKRQVMTLSEAFIEDHEMSVYNEILGYL